MAVPLIVHDRVVGVMDLESDRIGFFNEDHVRTLTLLAPQVASSVENARLYAELAQRERGMEEDLAAARELQRVLIPDASPEIEGIDAAVRLRPAREISGDIYDVFDHKDQQTVIAMGDVSGKGAAAALYGALVTGLLRTLAPRRRSPAELMRKLNDVLIERKVEARYVTLGVLLWDPPTRQIVIANAGGLPPMICRGTEILKIRAEGVPIGLLENTEYEETMFQAQRGDVIVVYSDGITDHMSPSGTEFGRGRLAQVVRTSCGMRPDDLIGRIFAELDRFNPVAFDDQSIFVMRVK